MDYFRLVEDVNVSRRWYFGEVLEVDNNWAFFHGEVDPTTIGQLSIDVRQGERPLDFCKAGYAGVPVASPALPAAWIGAGLSSSDIDLISVAVRSTDRAEQPPSGGRSC